MSVEYSINGVTNFRLFGFATGSYMCKCAICGNQFFGDKRARQCLDCALKAVQPTTAPMQADAQTLRSCQNCGNKFGFPCQHECKSYEKWQPRKASA